MKIIICDDEQAFVDSLIIRLKTELSEYDKDVVFIPFSNGVDAVEYAESQDFDVIFLDIDMPNMNGFEVAEKIREKRTNVAVIFCTCHEDFVFSSFEYQPFWFVRKNNMEDLSAAIEKLVKKIRCDNREYIFKSGKKHVTMRLNDITYFESKDHNVLIYTNCLSEQFVSKLSDVESQLEGFGFVRIHVGFLVNCKHIKKISSSNSVILENGTELSISRSKLKETQNKFQKYMRSIR